MTTKSNEAHEIEVRDASLQTATISIRTLQVNNKQMTLAVFRQLPDAGLYSDASGERCDGQIWGWVNYHAGCKTELAHFHVIWQDGNELVQNLIYWHTRDEINHWICRSPGLWFAGGDFTRGGIPVSDAEQLRLNRAAAQIDVVHRNLRKEIEAAGQLFIAV